MDNKLFLYNLLSSLPIKLSYPAKLMVFAFLGIHIPLLALIFYIAMESQLSNWVEIIIVALIATLAGTGITLFIISRLLYPVKMIMKALQRFTNERELPMLPVKYDDEVGELMQQTQYSLEEMDSFFMIKNNLLSIISHDTKTPIGSIEMSCGLLLEEVNEDQPDKKEMKELIELIRVSNENQNSIIKDMVTLARFDEREIDIDREITDPDLLIHRLEDTFELYFRQKKISFQHSVEEKIDNLYIDKQKILVVLNNLVQNAIKYTEAGGEVEVIIRKNEERAEISVKDTGCGISEVDLENIFEPFVGRKSGTEKEQGSGMGLWIANTFVKLHNGSIIVESNPGKGSEFIVVLPGA